MQACQRSCLQPRARFADVARALACRRFFQFETIIPCHYKTFPVLVQSPDKFIEELGGDGAKVKAMKPGESLTL